MTQQECSYNGCNQDAQEYANPEKQELPACYDHLGELIKNGEDNGPDQKLQSGSVHLDIWQNQDSPDTYSFKRFYTEDDGENFKQTQNMRPRDLPHIATLIRKVKLGEVEEK